MTIKVRRGGRRKVKRYEREKERWNRRIRMKTRTRE